MRKLKDYDGYRIIKCDGYYIVSISSTKANQFITYEYDASCATYDELDDYLKHNDFYTVIKDFREQCVYCECVEEIY